MTTSTTNTERHRYHFACGDSTAAGCTQRRCLVGYLVILLVATCLVGILDFTENLEDISLLFTRELDNSSSSPTTTTITTDANTTTTSLLRGVIDGSAITSAGEPPNQPALRITSSSDINQKNKPPLWFLWLDDDDQTAVHRAAIDSCNHTNHEHFDIIRVVRHDANESSLGFALHPSYNLLDVAQKADYLQIELLHHHGGIVLQASVFCLQPLHSYLEKLDVSKGIVGAVAGMDETASFTTRLGSGPYLKNSAFTQSCHEALWRTMDELEPALKQCAINHPDGSGGIAYPQNNQCATSATNNKNEQSLVSFCGTKCDALVDPIQKLVAAAVESGTLVSSFRACNAAAESSSSSCHVALVDCHVAETSNNNICQGEYPPCDRYPMLQKARHIPCNDSDKQQQKAHTN